MSPECSFGCGRRADQFHHATGRDHLGRYLDPMLVLPTEHDCHEFAHDDWRQERLNDLVRPRTIVEYVAIRLRRLAMNLARLDAGVGGGTFFGLMAEAMQRWADALD